MIKKRTAHLLMIFVVFLWGLDIVVAKDATSFLPPICVTFSKYAIGAVIIGAITIAKEGFSFVSKKDFPQLIICAITGQVLYSLFQYKALDFMAVSLITVMLAFVPTVSIILEKILYHRSANKKIYIGLFLSVIGVALTVGGDWKVILQGEVFGYLLCLGAILSWNCYNFITASFSNNYTPLSLSFNQMLCTSLIAMPFAIANMPEISSFSLIIVSEMVYIGVSAGITFIIYIMAIHAIGPTAISIYSNLYPVTATILAWLFLNESIGMIQLIGGAIVIFSACFIIVEKNRLDKIHENSIKEASIQNS